MRKSCISLVLSGALASLAALEASASDTIIANFADKNGSESNKGTYDSATKNGDSRTNATYGTDWTGSDSFIRVQSSNLTFTFGKNGTSQGREEVFASSAYSKLLFKDGFVFQNSSSYGVKQQRKLTITWGNDAKTSATLIFGQNGNPNSYLMIDENLEVSLSKFANVEVGGNLFLQSQAKLDAKEAQLHNTSGITLQKGSQIIAKTFKNDGTLAMGNGSSFQTGQIDSSSDKRGKIDVQGDARLILSSPDAASSTPPATLALAGAQSQQASIKNQDILIRHGSFTISNKSSSESALLVDLADTKTLSLEGVKFEAQSGSATIEGFESLESKDLSLQSIQIQAKELKTLTNTKISLANSTLRTEQDLTIKGANGSGRGSGSGGSNGKSTFLLNGSALISAGEKSVTIEGDHALQGSGVLNILGKTITLGKDASTISLMKSTASDSAKLALAASDSVISKNLKLENLTMQLVQDEKAAKLQNEKLTLGNASVIEAINRKGELVDLVIDKNSNNGTMSIEAAKNSTITIDNTQEVNATLRGKNIKITENDITFNGNGHKSRLTLEAREGRVTLGGANDAKALKISISGSGTATNNILDLKTSQVYLGKNVELSGVLLTAGGESGVSFYGSKEGTLSFKNAASISTERDGKYGEMSFGVQFEENETQGNGAKSNLKFEGDTDLKAANFVFLGQKVSLSKAAGTSTGISARSAGATNGVSLKLYALGQDGKAEKGTFLFADTTFSVNSATGTAVGSSGTSNFSANSTTGAAAGSSAVSNPKIALYTNQEAVLMVNNLTLDGIDLTSIKSKSTQLQSADQELAALDLSASSGKLTALSSVTISANGIYSSARPENAASRQEAQREQGIGMDIYVGDSSKSGQLTIKSDVKSDKFFIGGNLVIDNSASNGTQSSLKIELGKNDEGKNGTAGAASVSKLEDQTLELEILGGLAAIGKIPTSSSSVLTGAQTNSSTEIKAKKFIFGATSSLVSINGTLKLNTKEDDTIEIKGKTILQGTENAEAKIEVVKNGNSGVVGIRGVGGLDVSNGTVALKLHDIESTGKGSISNKGLTFMDSNIVAKGSGNAKSLILTDETVAAETIFPVGTAPYAKNLMSGSISSITLDGGNLEFKRGDGKNRSNGVSTPSTAGIKLNSNGFIQSSGDSKLKLKTIQVGTSGEDRFALKVLDGTFKLVEEHTANQIGAITLGDKDKNKGGNFVFLKQENGTQNSVQVTAAQASNTPIYNDLKLQGDLRSFGDSSIKVNQLILSQKKGGGYYTISSSNGTLRFDLMGNQGVEFKNDFVLENGGLSFNDSSSQAMGKISFRQSTIQSRGNSKILGSELDLDGAPIGVQGGRLVIQGVKTSTLAGNISVGNAGVLAVQNYQGSRASLSILAGKSVSLSAVAPYVSPSDPFGGGSFGKIEVKSLIFEGLQAEKNLINLALIGESNAATLQDDRLFALREGKIILIDTEAGIKKKTGNAQYSNITLKDVSVDRGSYTSITLTPKLEMDKTLAEGEIVKQLTLDVSVVQKTISQLMESIKDPSKKKLMQDFFSNPLNQAIAESILQSKDNVFKAGLAEYISSGNIGVVSSSLQYMTAAFQGATDGIYASDKIIQELRMLRATNLENRMLRSGNPYISRVEIAHLLKALSGVRYASEDDELLLDAEYSGPNYGSIWATYEGATSFGMSDNASVNGLSAGYDTLLGDLREHLLGFYVNYGYGTYSANFVKNNSHNFGLGLYSRLTFDRNEVELVLSQSIGMNRSDLYVGASNALTVQYLNQKLKYNFFITDAQLRYGYLIAVGDKESPFYFKPFGGLDFGVTVNSQSKGDGLAAIGIDRSVNFKLGISFGLEMKKYFNEGSHIYLLPVLEKALVNDSGTTNLGFVGAQTIPFVQAHQVNSAFALYAGGQGSVSKDVSMSGGLGVKVDVETKDVLTNWNIGFKYHF